MGVDFDWQMQCERSEIRNSQKGVIDQKAISGESRIVSEFTEVGKAEMIIQWVGDADSWMSGGRPMKSECVGDADSSMIDLRKKM